jgi:hypothetical protein
MAAQTLLRRFALCVSLIATLALAAYTGSAAAQAVPGTFTSTETLPPSTGGDLCTGLSGTTTNTITNQFHFIDMPDGTFHVILTNTQNYRSDWSDGTYLISQAITHLDFQTSPTGEAVRSFTEQDRGTLYSPDGQAIGYQTVFTQGHITWNNGTITTSPSQFRVNCG